MEPLGILQYDQDNLNTGVGGFGRALPGRVGFVSYVRVISPFLVAAEGL